MWLPLGDEIDQPTNGRHITFSLSEIMDLQLSLARLFEDAA